MIPPEMGERFLKTLRDEGNLKDIAAKLYEIGFDGWGRSPFKIDQSTGKSRLFLGDDEKTDHL